MTGNPWEQLLLRNLRVGSVVYTHCDFCTPDPKNKYLVVASLNPRCLVLVINSNINQYFVTTGQDKYHVPVPASDHTFLDHDSYTNCIDAKDSFEVSFLQHETLNNYNNFHKGWLTEACLTDVYNAVKEQKVMRRGHKREIIASLEKQLGINN